MTTTIDVEAILAPIEGASPAGEYLRYTPIYDEIQEARREDDQLDLGDWQRPVKVADWPRVVELTAEVLAERSKDLQLAAWLLEGLIRTRGFPGLAAGLQVLSGLLERFWDSLYPEIEDGDLDFRIGPFEFVNNKLWVLVKQVPVTDPAAADGFSWFKWQESRQVGYESSVLNRYGDIDEDKKRVRDELIAEGKITAEAFDAAVAKSSKEFYRGLFGEVGRCLEEFQRLDQWVDERFGAEAPRLAEFREALEDCKDLVERFFREKLEQDPDLEESEAAGEEAAEGDAASSHPEAKPSGLEEPTIGQDSVPVLTLQSEVATTEEAVWQQAQATLSRFGIKDALEQLLAAALSAPSVRGRNRYRLLMAKLCLKAGRPDLARPIVEELHSLIEELNLERWESPTWIAEVIDALYQCLTSGEPTDDDRGKARMLLRRLCTIDVTKAMAYKS